jgi:uncharacterized protein (TIGR03118 family)
MMFPFSPANWSKRPGHQRPRTARLELERLDDRVLLSGYQQLNLVGFQPGMGRLTDPNLNGWGMATAPDGSFCVANTFSTGVATFYDRSGHVLPLTITVPASAAHPFGPVGHPTGVVYNSTTDFVISANGKSAPARFLFDTVDGTISGWNPDVDPTHAIVLVDSFAAGQPAVYTGLDIGRNSHGQNVLYAADILNNRVDMVDGSFHVFGSFTDPNVAVQYPGLGAWQVEDVGGRLYVTFGTLAPPFGGVVDVFDMDGHLLTPSHFAANAPGAGPLQNPWAVVQAPANFGAFSNDLLIGNVEGPGYINAFDPVTGAYLGQLRQPDGTPVAIAGLWDLTFGTGTPASGPTNQLFFDAGPNAPNLAGNGLFGVIHAAGDQSGNSDVAAALATPAAGQGSAAAPSPATPGAQPTQTVTLLAPGSAAATGSALSTMHGRSQYARALDALFAGLDDSWIANIL